jgi:cytochrome c peroxidase
MMFGKKSALPYILVLAAVSMTTSCNFAVAADKIIVGAITPLKAVPDVDAEKAALGRELFYDRRLSKNGTISCNECHDLNHGGMDGRNHSVNTPTVFNSVFNFKQFWDGRADSLYDQIEGPINSPEEMASNWSDIIYRLSLDPETKARFKTIYKAPIGADNIKNALVEFEKTLVTLNAPFDRYLEGDDHALTENQIRGYKKFMSFGCVSCHQGQNIGGNMFQTVGITADYFKDRGEEMLSDGGRFNITKLESDRHVFKVPSLRNVALTAPYFHDGATKTLDEAVRKMAKYQLGRALSAADVNDIVDFLNSLTGQLPASVKPFKRDSTHEK